MLKFVKLIWLGLCIWVLIDALLDPKIFSNGELITIFELKVLALTSPLGFVLEMILQGLFVVFESFAELWKMNVSLWADLVVFWAIMVSAGYLQWFVLLPKNVRRLKNRARSV
ncbi:MAG: hypothetical protein GY952_07535 [Rhodobacteraceae bacterium]|nr:hypothetical protein [Paracoccaceae bacterium]